MERGLVPGDLFEAVKNNLDISKIVQEGFAEAAVLIAADIESNLIKSIKETVSERFTDEIHDRLMEEIEADYIG